MNYIGIFFWGCWIFSLPEIIDMNNQCLFETDNRGKPPDALGYKNLLSPSGVRYYFLEGVYNNIVIVLEGNRHPRGNTTKVRGCRYTKLINSRYRYNRYRYHKNTIIDNGVLPLVGFWLFAARACSRHCWETMWVFYSLSLAHVWPLLRWLWQRYCMIASSRFCPGLRHEFPMVNVCMRDFPSSSHDIKRNLWQLITSTWTSCFSFVQ